MCLTAQMLVPLCLQGFVVGTSHGTLCAFERDSDSKPYRLIKSFPVPGGSSAGAAPAEAGAAAPAAAAPVAAPAAGTAAAASAGPAPPRVCSLTVCPGDEGIACLTSDAQLLQLAVAPGARKGVFSGLQPLAPAFHAGEITGLATCVRRPVVATAGADRTLRVWNWQDKSSELVGLLGGWGLGWAAAVWFVCMSASWTFEQCALMWFGHPCCRSRSLMSRRTVCRCTPPATCCWPGLPTSCA